jgi:hypothetical protein
MLVQVDQAEWMMPDGHHDPDLAYTVSDRLSQPRRMHAVRPGG